jgi:hypothetical protein
MPSVNQAVRVFGTSEDAIAMNSKAVNLTTLDA